VKLHIQKSGSNLLRSLGVSDAPEKPERRVDIGDVTLVWGDPARWKARLRDESLRAHLSRPIAERLAVALSMVVPRKVMSAAGAETLARVGK
jgi:hypothetical protein